VIEQLQKDQELCLQKMMLELKRDPRKLKWTKKYVKGGIKQKKR
jgi:ribosomal protein L24E